MNSSLNGIITGDSIEKLRSIGVLIFDIDDTLLARRDGSTAKGETYSESGAAMLLPDLLRSGIRVGLVTGHGWEQLDKRMVTPLLAELSNEPIPLGDRLFIYANRGATRIELGAGGSRFDEVYGEPFTFTPAELSALTEILTDLSEKLAPYTRDTTVELREGVVLSLRTVAKEIPEWESLRQALIVAGRASLLENGLDARFEVEAAGKNSIEIASFLAAKPYACADLFARVARMAACSDDDARHASIYVGDEFGQGGNDLDVVLAYPDLKCISVSLPEADAAPANLTLMNSKGEYQGSEGTYEIIASILKLLD